MRLKSFRIKNYKSFDDSGTHQLADHMNVVVGQNNVGKTALLQALSTRMRGTPHNNSSKKRDQALPENSTVEFQFQSSGEELRDELARTGAQIFIPVSSQWKGSIEHHKDFMFAQAALVFKGWISTKHNSGIAWHSKMPSVKLTADEPIDQSIRIQVNDNKTDFRLDPGGKNDTVLPMMGEMLRRQIYFFNALRTPTSTSAFGHETVLRSDAINLPEVLNALQASRSAYGDYIELVRRVLPTVKHVNVVPKEGNTLEIRVWNVEEKTRREDLAVPLENCGTGVGQILALLYVVSRTSGSIVIIDEPNSFLHPGATKALISILREHTNHQFVISTHSPEIITSAEPQQLFMLTFQDEKTKIEDVDRKDLNAARRVLDEIGSRLFDVLGMDAVIWVEGPTEADCFPALLDAAGRPLKAGETIAALRATGDLEGKHAEAVAEIYRSISAAGALFPSHLRVSLDGDKTQHPKAKALHTAFGDVLRFLHRRTYENYLLHSEAIAALARSLPGFSENGISSEAVQEWMHTHGRNKKYRAEGCEPGSAEWLKNVDGAAFLYDLFQDLSSAKEIYDKRIHGLALTNWLISNDPKGAIKELQDYVVELLPRSAQ